MALTKVTLIADSTISDVHINNLTTDALIEGNKLFYTNDRVASYLAANNFATTGAGYFYDATLSANILTFSKSDGTTDSVDLSLYLDDTNLARLVSGTLDGLTGIATFTRDDSSTFTVDFSSFLADANDYVSSGSFDTSTGVITLTRQSGATVTFDLDGKYAEAAHTHDDRYYTELESDGRFAPISHTHLWSHITDRPTALSAFTNDLGNYGGFLTSFTETDPIYTASSWYTTQNNSANWDAAYGWGNHAGLYSLLGHTHDYLPIGGKAADSELLDGIDSSQFVRNDTSRSQVSNYMDIANVTSGSFRIYDGTTFRGGFGTSRWSDSVSAVDQMSIYSVGDGINFYTGNSSAIRAVINSDYLYHVSDVRSPLFYDSDNTGYYVNPSSTSVMATVSAGVLNGTDIYTTGGWFRNHTNSNGIYWSATGWHLFPHNDSDFRIHSGNGTNVSLRMETNGTTRGYIYAENDNTIGFLSNSRSWSFRTYSDGNALVYGYLTANSSLRAPIFYDSNDTNYYIDANGNSRIFRLNVSENQPNAANNAGGRVRVSSFSNGASEISNDTYNILLGPAGTRTGTGYYAGIAINGLMNYYGSTSYDAAPHIWIGAQYRDTPGSERSDFVIGVKSGTGVSGTGTDIPQERFRVDYAGIATATGSLRAPVFYDSNDTGYYVDPAGTHRQNHMDVNTGSFGRLGINNSSNSTRYGLSLYGGYNSGEPTYGILFTGTSLGTHGSVTGDWATYFTMNDNTNRGWIFRRVGAQNVASISGGGVACFNGNVSSNGDIISYGCGVCHLGPTTSYGLLASYGVSGSYFGSSYSMSTITGIQLYPSTGENFCYDTCNGALYIGGTIYQNYYSDCKYKENITVIESALDKIDGIRGVEFDWNALGQEEIYKSGHEVGFIAQEVQAVYPQAVREVYKEREDKIVSALVIDQEKLIPLLLQGIKELKSEIKALKEYLNIS